MTNEQVPSTTRLTCVQEMPSPASSNMTLKGLFERAMYYEAMDGPRPEPPRRIEPTREKQDLRHHLLLVLGEAMDITSTAVTPDD